MIADDAEHFLEVAGVGCSYPEDSVCLTRHGVRLGNLWNGADHLPHPVRRHPALAVDLHEGLNRPAECRRFNVGSEAPDHAAETQPIDPSFGGRSG